MTQDEALALATEHGASREGALSCTSCMFERNERCIHPAAVSILTSHGGFVSVDELNDKEAPPRYLGVLTDSPKICLCRSIDTLCGPEARWFLTFFEAYS